ncbi:MAG: glycosyltransferase family 4 protein [Actinomycetota bacterium]
MRILFVNQYFPPDSASTANLLGELCEDLAARGHEVHVVAGRPSYDPDTSHGPASSRSLRESSSSPLAHGPDASDGRAALRSHAKRRRHRLITRERWNGVQVTRTFSTTFVRSSVGGRLANYLTFTCSALLGCLRAPRPGVVVSMTDPPVVGLVAWMAARLRRAPLVCWCQDVFPEVAVVLGWLKPGGVSRILGCLTLFVLRRAATVVVIGEDMARRLVVKGVLAERIQVIPNWSDSAVVMPADGGAFRQSCGLDGGLLLMHSGNVGLSQALDTIVDAVALLGPDGNRPGGDRVALAILGDGAGKAALEQGVRQKGIEAIRFLPRQPKEKLAECLSAADIHLVSLKRGLAGYVVPSKVYGIMAAGKPFIAAVDPDSEVAGIVRRHRCGVLVDPEDPVALATAVRELAADPVRRQEMGRRGREALLAHYDRPLAAERFETLLKSVNSREGGRESR